MSILTLPTTTDDYILDGLSPADMFRYSRTCRAAHSTVEAYKKRAFQVDKLLARYFTPPQVVRFRELQCHTETLISGSTALQFFDRTIYPESDLDLYVEHRFSREVAEWLIEIGYKYAPLPESQNVLSLEEAFKRNPPNREHVPDIFSGEIFFDSEGNDYFKAPFVFNFENQHPCRKIQLITSLQCPLQRILSFHSTCVMNVITHDAAYSLFPWATFEERRSLICLERNDIGDKAFQKYADRGWSFVTLHDLRREKKDALESFAIGTRFIGDRSCWKIPIYPELDLPQGYIESNSWSMDCTFYYSNPYMSYTFLVTKELKFSYLIARDEDCDMEGYISDHIRARDWDEPKDTLIIKQDDKLQTLVRKYRADLGNEDIDLIEAELSESESESESQDDYSDSD